MRPLAVILMGVLTLSGCTSVVNTITSEPIVPDPASTSVGTSIDDIKMDTYIGVNIKKADPELAKSHININVVNAVVLMTGEVPSKAKKQIAGDVARAFKGVRQVHNELQVRGKTSIVSRTNDTMLTAKIKTKLIFEEKVKATNIEVITEDSVVYLMGLVSKSIGAKAANRARETGGARRVATVFEYIE